MKVGKLLCTAACAFSFSAQAYIPEYSLIATRASEQHGKGAYLIEQEVTFRKESEVHTVKETWIVTGENNSRVTIEGRGALRGLVQGTMIYEGSLKTFLDPSAQAKNQRLGDEWLEPLLHFRFGKYFRSRMVNLKVAPAESLRDRAPLNAEGPPKYEPLSFLRLSRVGGAVTWAIGMSPNVGTSPTAWIEQDQFLLRKYRSANQTTMRADGYAKHQEGMWYPKTITYAFGDYTVTTNTLQVKHLGKIAPTDARFKMSSLNAQRDALKLPDVDGLREFYSRFR